MDHANLLDVLVEDKVKFKSSYEVGDASMEIFMDKTNPWNKSIHPALPKIIQEKLLANRRYGKNETLLTAQAFQKNYKCLRNTEKKYFKDISNFGNKSKQTWIKSFEVYFCS